jgi:hypothetical protein
LKLLLDELPELDLKDEDELGLLELNPDGRELLLDELDDVDFEPLEVAPRPIASMGCRTRASAISAAQRTLRCFIGVVINDAR